MASDRALYAAALANDRPHPSFFPSYALCMSSNGLAQCSDFCVRYTTLFCAVFFLGSKAERVLERQGLFCDPWTGPFVFCFRLFQSVRWPPMK